MVLLFHMHNEGPTIVGMPNEEDFDLMQSAQNV